MDHGGNPLMIAAVFIGFALQLMVTEQPALVAAFQTVAFECRGMENFARACGHAAVRP